MKVDELIKFLNTVPGDAHVKVYHPITDEFEDVKRVTCAIEGVVYFDIQELDTGEI